MITLRAEINNIGTFGDFMLISIFVLLMLIAPQANTAAIMETQDAPCSRKEDTSCLAMVDTEPTDEFSAKATAKLLAETMGKNKWDEMRIWLWNGANPNILSGTQFYEKALSLYLNRSLIVAATRGDNDKILRLLSQGAEINVQENFQEWMSPLINAARCGHLDTVRLLLDNAADVNSPGEYTVGYNGLMKNSTALFWATLNRHTEIVELLLQRKADPNAQQIAISDQFAPNPEKRKGSTILMASSCVKTTLLLLQYGADPNLATDNGETRLMDAAASGMQDECALLLRYGAKPDLLTTGGITATDLARQYGHQDLVDLLEKHKSR